MLRLLILALLFLNVQSIFSAEQINGFSAEGQFAYYVIDKNVYCRNVVSDKQVWMKDLSNDTGMTNRLHKIVVKDLSIKDETISRNIKESIRNFNFVNITVRKSKIYIGLRFWIKSSSNEKCRFAIAEFDSTLKVSNLYHFNLRQPFKFFTLPPYFPLNFQKDGIIILPIFSDTSIHLYSFELNAKLQKAMPDNAQCSSLSILKTASLDYGSSLILDPMFHLAQNSNQYYFQFPIPYFKGINSNQVDPFRLKNQIDSINRNKSKLYSLRTDEILALSSNPNMRKAIAATYQVMDTLFVVIKNKNENKSELIKIDIKSGIFTVSSYKLPDSNSDFYLNDKYLYVLRTDNPHKIIRKNIKDLF